MRLFASLLFLFLFSVAPQAARAQEIGLEARLEGLPTYPCEESGFTCLTLAVPIDPANLDLGTLPITYSFAFAEKESKGILVYIQGGPGAVVSGSVAAYLRSFDQEIRDSYDFVFFDHRGIDPAHGLSCPVSQVNLLSLPSAFDPSFPQAFRDVMAACIAEMPGAELLPYFNTAMAIEDLELFRQAIGGPKLTLVGQSYGTIFAQLYAKEHPQAVAALILDGTLDSSLTPDEWDEMASLEGQRVLDHVLEGCTKDEVCLSDLGPDPKKLLEEVDAKLAEGIFSFPVKLTDNSWADIPISSLTFSDGIVFENLYTPYARGALLRALAAFNNGRTLPLARLALGAWRIDLTKSGLAPSPILNVAAYFAISCANRTESAKSGDTQAIEEAQKLGREKSYFASFSLIFPSACQAFPPTALALPTFDFQGGDYPTLILVSDADPVTPLPMAQATFAGAKNAAIVEIDDASHGLMGWDIPCVDAAVWALLIRGTLPKERMKRCEFSSLIMQDPLLVHQASDLANPETVAEAIIFELLAIDELSYSGDGDSGWEPCDFGGDLTYNNNGGAVVIDFSGCAFWSGLPLNGQVTFYIDQMDWVAGRITFAGSHRGLLTFRVSGYTLKVTGVYDGKPVDLTTSYP